MVGYIVVRKPPGVNKLDKQSTSTNARTALSLKEEVPWIILVTLVAFALLAFDRFAVEHRFFEFFGADLLAAGYTSSDVRLAAQVWLSGACAVLLVILPLLYLWCLRLPALRTHAHAHTHTHTHAHTWGLGFAQAAQHKKIYLGFMAVMLPVLWILAGTDAFNYFYPLFDPTTWQRWVLFEVVYLTQFFCVEFFFRGPLLFRLESRFGLAAIGMMVVPYALLHIYKPFPEALGSIAAGFLLGFLSLKPAPSGPVSCCTVVWHSVWICLP